MSLDEGREGADDELEEWLRDRRNEKETTEASV